MFKRNGAMVRYRDGQRDGDVMGRRPRVEERETEKERVNIFINN